MNISVAMVTYNGHQHIREQLASIARQSRLPDQLVIWDDGSTDGTPEIAESTTQFFPFDVVVRRGSNVGMHRNVERAIRECTGDLIAVADQDDVWNPEKLAESESVFCCEPEVGLIFGDAEVVNENLDPMGYTIWESVYFGRRDKSWVKNNLAFPLLLRRDIVQGGSIVFRSQLRDIMLPFPVPPHRMPDAWLALVASSVAPIRFIDHPVLRYRQHVGQSIGSPRNPTLARRIKRSVLAPVGMSPRTRLSLIELDTLTARLKEYGGHRASKSMQFAEFDAKHVSLRASLPTERVKRLPLILKELASGGYRKHSAGLITAASDAVRAR